MVEQVNSPKCFFTSQIEFIGYICHRPNSIRLEEKMHPFAVCKPEAGVGILVNEEWAESVVQVSRVSDRCMWIKIMVGTALVTIVSVYALQAGRCDEGKEKFWEDLTTVIEGPPSTDKLIVAG
jgi:hypothetical protein